jgi:hypothetical protein
MAVPTLEPQSEARRRGGARPARLYGMKHAHPVLASRMALERTALPFEPRLR